MPNVIVRINKKYTYAQIARRIQETTGREYSEGHIGNVAREEKPLSDSLHFNLMRAFPEFFLPTSSVNGEIVLTE